MLLIRVYDCGDVNRNLSTVELQWLEHLWNHENMFETFHLMSVNHSARSGSLIGINIQFSLI